MSVALILLLAAGIAAPEPLALEATRGPSVVEVDFELAAAPPDEISQALVSGAEVRLVYPLRVKARRKGWIDRKLWSGELVTFASLDPVLGRYRCQVVLDGIITSTGEADSPEEALEWLTDPPEVRVELPEARRRAVLKVRVRAIFSSGTTWLIFPTQDATPWVEISLDPLPDPDADAT
jgi:hypothetical protein